MWRARQTVHASLCSKQHPRTCVRAAPRNIMRETNSRPPPAPPPTPVLMLRAHPVRRYFALTLPEITPRDYPRLPESRRTWIGTTTRARCGSPSAACAIRLRTRSRRRSCSLRSMERRAAARCPCGASCSRCGRQSQTIRRRGSRWAGGRGGGGRVLCVACSQPAGCHTYRRRWHGWGCSCAGTVAELDALNTVDPLQILCHLSNELETQAAHRR